MENVVILWRCKLWVVGVDYVLYVMMVIMYICVGCPQLM